MCVLGGGEGDEKSRMVLTWVPKSHAEIDLCRHRLLAVDCQYVPGESQVLPSIPPAMRSHTGCFMGTPHACIFSSIEIAPGPASYAFRAVFSVASGNFYAQFGPKGSQVAGEA